MSISFTQSLLLGIVQGLTEFLPISSSAHLILLPRVFKWPDTGLAFDVALHLGTLAAVLAYFWRDLLNISRKTLGFLIIATIPGALAGLLLENTVETIFRSPHLIGWTLIIMGTALAVADRMCKGDKRVSDLNFKSAMVIGIGQAFALVPGVSRSGVTITTALALGFARPEAARFSFLLSIPIIAGAGTLKMKAILLTPDRMVLAAGCAGAAISGFLAIWGLMTYVQTKRYTPFVIYRWILGLFVLLHF